MKYLYTLIILHTQANYCGFRLIDNVTGKMVEGSCGLGTESNILNAIRFSESVGWRDDSVVTKNKIRERELFAIPYAGCSPNSIREFCESNGITLPK